MLTKHTGIVLIIHFQERLKENETRKKKSLFGISGLLTNIEADPVQLSGNFGKILIPKLRCIHSGSCGSAFLSLVPFVSPDIQSLQTVQC